MLECESSPLCSLLQFVGSVASRSALRCPLQPRGLHFFIHVASEARLPVLRLCETAAAGQAHPVLKRG
jgi:hypothetical protein